MLQAVVASNVVGSSELRREGAVGIKYHAIIGPKQTDIQISFRK